MAEPGCLCWARLFGARGRETKISMSGPSQPAKGQAPAPVKLAAGDEPATGRKLLALLMDTSSDVGRSADKASTDSTGFGNSSASVSVLDPMASSTRASSSGARDSQLQQRNDSLGSAPSSASTSLHHQPSLGIEPDPQQQQPPQPLQVQPQQQQQQHTPLAVPAWTPAGEEGIFTMPIFQGENDAFLVVAPTSAAPPAARRESLLQQLGNALLGGSSIASVHMVRCSLSTIVESSRSIATQSQRSTPATEGDCSGRPHTSSNHAAGNTGTASGGNTTNTTATRRTSTSSSAALARVEEEAGQRAGHQPAPVTGAERPPYLEGYFTMRHSGSLPAADEAATLLFHPAVLRPPSSNATSARPSPNSQPSGNGSISPAPQSPFLPPQITSAPDLSWSPLPRAHATSAMAPAQRSTPISVFRRAARGLTPPTSGAAAPRAVRSSAPGPLGPSSDAIFLIPVNHAPGAPAGAGEAGFSFPPGGFLAPAPGVPAGQQAVILGPGSAGAAAGFARASLDTNPTPGASQQFECASLPMELLSLAEDAGDEAADDLAQTYGSFGGA